MMKCELKEKFWSSSVHDYVVRNNEGKELFKVDGNVLTVRDKMILRTPGGDGKKLCMIRERVVDGELNSTATFQVLTYVPRSASQPSTETDDGVPVFRYASVVAVPWKVGNNWGDQYNCYLYGDDNERGETALYSAFRETWRWAWDSKVNVFKGDQIKRTNGTLARCDLVAKFGTFDKKWWDNTDMNNRCGIELSPGVDPILVICMAIISDAMRDKLGRGRRQR